MTIIIIIIINTSVLSLLLLLFLVLILQLFHISTTIRRIQQSIGFVQHHQTNRIQSQSLLFNGIDQPQGCRHEHVQTAFSSRRTVHHLGGVGFGQEQGSQTARLSRSQPFDFAVQLRGEFQ